MASNEYMKQGAARRKQILTFTRRYIKKHGYGPSTREITEGVGLSSTSTTRYHLMILEQERKVTMAPGKYRSLRVK